MANTKKTSSNTTKNGWETLAEAISSMLPDDADEGFFKDNSDAELLIVTGPGGVGKSSFIGSVTDMNVFVGSTLDSGTTTTRLVPTRIGGRLRLFLDMPGFNTHDFDDWDVFRKLMAAMCVAQPHFAFRGVIFVDSMEAARITPAAEKILEWLWRFCGQDYMPNVMFVTTKWDELSTSGMETRRARVEQWKEKPQLRRFFTHGATIYHHGLVKQGGSYKRLDINADARERRSLARDAIGNHYHDPTDLTLQIYDEIAHDATLDTTSAGRFLKYGHAGPPKDAEEDAETTAGPSRSTHEPWGGPEFWESVGTWARILGKVVHQMQSPPSGGFRYTYQFPGDPFSIPSDIPPFHSSYDSDGYQTPPFATGDFVPDPEPTAEPKCRIM